MDGAGLTVERAKGECNLGQHEIALPLRRGAAHRATTTSVYKTGAKEIAAQHGKSLTFMAKFDEREGNSCHIHLSLRGARRRARCSPTTSRPAGAARCSTSFVAGRAGHACASFTLLYAPNINSYKRFAAGLVRADRGRLGRRQPHLRAAGGRARRRRCGWRTGCPAATSTPTWRSPAMIAGGLHGIEQRAGARAGAAPATPTPPTSARVPRTLREARDAVRRVRAVARAAFGDEVVDHYANTADVELAAFDAAVTDWELRRGFERL